MSVQWRTRGQAFYSRDVAACGLPGRNQTRTDRLAVQQYCAGTTIARVASDLGSGESKIVAKYSGEAAGA
jgi:hypothetical protein